MGVWNDFQISLYFVTDTAKNTLPLSIYSFVGYMTYKWNYVCAFIVLSILPILLIYCIAQDVYKRQEAFCMSCSTKNFR